MITIISGTNRADSYTLRVAKEYQRLLAEKDVEANVFSLEDINLMKRDKAFEQIENEVIIPSQSYIFISPEYNGSFPGALKLFIDTAKPRQIWWNKKALLTGVATGRAGNLRGMDHLSGVLNHLKIMVHPNQLPISSVDKLMDENGNFTDVNTLKVINNQIDEFIKWINS
ncbi:NADPH-dependent FMN reductase [Ferruginibacter sp. SUN002]|uniref:NADPH-dependent FMN reductase n=1 Tax=Ferruginibacter sp. SUN002 TaxID=2937789 RepID=UPI003D359CFF